MLTKDNGKGCIPSKCSKNMGLWQWNVFLWSVLQRVWDISSRPLLVRSQRWTVYGQQRTELAKDKRALIVTQRTCDNEGCLEESLSRSWQEALARTQVQYISVRPSLGITCKYIVVYILKEWWCHSGMKLWLNNDETMTSQWCQKWG